MEHPHQGEEVDHLHLSQGADLQQHLGPEFPPRPNLLHLLLPQLPQQQLPWLYLLLLLLPQLQLLLLLLLLLPCRSSW